MLRSVVVSQSMYFPWVGLLEQVALSDVFVHYDDVQYTRGFCNRVQIKTKDGIKWITVPLKKHHQKTNIDKVVPLESNWREEHINLVMSSCKGAAFRGDVQRIMERVLFESDVSSIASVGRNSIIELSKYFEIAGETKFVDSRDLGLEGRSTQRLLAIVTALGGERYVTGHGARSYLDENQFLSRGIAVHYMDYEKVAYPQLHGAFTPFVSALDLVANCGRDGRKYIISQARAWTDDMAIAE